MTHRLLHHLWVRTRREKEDDDGVDNHSNKIYTYHQKQKWPWFEETSEFTTKDWSSSCELCCINLFVFILLNIYFSLRFSSFSFFLIWFRFVSMCMADFNMSNCQWKYHVVDFKKRFWKLARLIDSIELFAAHTHTHSTCYVWHCSAIPNRFRIEHRTLNILICSRHLFSVLLLYYLREFLTCFLHSKPK